VFSILLDDAVAQHLIPPARHGSTVGAAGVATTPRQRRRRSSRCPNMSCISPNTRQSWADPQPDC
jgi:hypothetical protein